MTENPFMGLRNMALTTKAKDIGIKTSDKHPHVWGVLMETGLENDVASLVAFADGSTSLHLSSGGGMIGGGGHEAVRKVAADFIAMTENYLEKFRAVEDFPLPSNGRVRFYLQTFDGVLTTEADEDALGNNQHALSSLFHKGHEVLTQLRYIDKGDKADNVWEGESGYVNCLLTAMAEGKHKEVIINTISPVPSLMPLAEGNEDLGKWIGTQRFVYEDLKTKLVCGIIMKSAGLTKLKFLKRKGTINAFLAGKDGNKPTPFQVEKITGANGELALRISQNVLGKWER